IGGGEESYGFLPETFVRDKDAVSSCALMAEIAAWAKDQGKSLYQLLLEIYVEYGFSREKGVSVVKKGKSGADEIKQMMVDFGANPPKEIAGSPVVLIKDFETLNALEPLTGKTIKLEMPATSNVLQYFSQDGSKVSIRPSGTEPKIKFYIEVRGEMASRSDYDAAVAASEVKVKAVMASLGL
ncbi:MAG: phospho-sugar mutase, partial [Bacteroidia bacterium]|nr:phospho-sugar mutase [Bacteroidia bacterium]